MSTEVIGHDDIIERLSVEIPPVSIFVGAVSVGKWTTAQWVRARLKVADGDYLEVRHLGIESARQIGNFVRRAPHRHVRLVIANVSGSGFGAQGVLQHELEDLPPTSLVILVAEAGSVHPPLMSRGEKFIFGRLQPEHIEDILLRRGFRQGTAEHLSTLADGRVQPALRMVNANETKITVIGAVRALLMRDAKALDTFAARWSEEHTALLDAMCREAITGRAVLFDPEDIEAFTRKLALRTLTVLRTEVRPRLVIHSQLMSVLRGD